MRERPTPYPLAWPPGWQRTSPMYRKDGKFRNYRADVTVAQGTQRVYLELQRFGVVKDDIVISTDLQTRLDGTIISRQGKPSDPAVAVYWTLDGDEQCIACDIYGTTQHNLCGVAASLDAMRAIERHGGATILKRAWQGFKALPSSTIPVLSAEQAFRTLIEMAGFNPPAGEVIDAIKALEYSRIAISKSHPDRWGGNQEKFLLAQECKRIIEAHLGVRL